MSRVFTHKTCVRACGVTSCVRACVLACLRACLLACLRACVLACLRAWEPIYLGSSHGNFPWELIVTLCVCFDPLRAFLHYVFVMQVVFTLRFCATRRFYTMFLRCKAFLHYVFALQVVFTQRF